MKTIEAPVLPETDEGLWPERPCVHLWHDPDHIDADSGDDERLAIVPSEDVIAIILCEPTTRSARRGRLPVAHLSNGARFAFTNPVADVLAQLGWKISTKKEDE